jgi:hypothetical protein
MNERIFELAKQALQLVADEHANGDESRLNLASYTVKDLIQEKFAELIVQECAQVCLSQRDPANLNYKPSERFAEAVKQHFGVDK